MSVNSIDVLRYILKHIATCIKIIQKQHKIRVSYSRSYKKL